MSSRLVDGAPLLGGKGIAITGGASGIGLAVARRCAALGAQVALLDLADRDGVADGSTLHFVHCDVTDGEGTAAALGQAAATLGGLDGVFANAGIVGTLAPIEEMTPDEWRRTTSVSFDGVFHTIRGSVEHLAARGGGSIVITSSIAGTRTFGTGGTAAYAAAKAGAAVLGQVAAVELGRHRIRVNSVAPGAVSTRFTEGIVARGLDRLAHERSAGIPLADGATSADDVAELVVFLLSDAAAKISGALIPVDGAQSLLGGGVMKSR